MRSYNCIRAQSETFRPAKRISVTAVIPVQNGWDCIGSLFPKWEKPAFGAPFQDSSLTPFRRRTCLSGALQPSIEGTQLIFSRHFLFLVALKCLGRLGTISTVNL